MASYPIAFLVTAPLVGARMQGIGRKNTLTIGVILITFSTLLFGLGGYCRDASTFYTVSFVGRLLQGVAEAIINVAIYSIVPIEFPEHQEQYLGYIALSEGVACSLGPLLGSLVYGYADYVGTFYFFTAFIGILGGVSVLMIPARVNLKNEQTEEQQNDPDCTITYM